MKSNRELILEMFKERSLRVAVSGHLFNAVGEADWETLVDQILSVLLPNSSTSHQHDAKPDVSSSAEDDFRRIEQAFLKLDTIFRYLAGLNSIAAYGRYCRCWDIRNTEDEFITKLK